MNAKALKDCPFANWGTIGLSKCAYMAPDRALSALLGVKKSFPPPEFPARLVSPQARFSFLNLKSRKGGGEEKPGFAILLSSVG